MFETQPPPDLQWFDIFGSAIALVLAVVTLPTAFQMWWGKPRPKVEFKERRVDPGVVLACTITNDVVKNIFLKKLGVRRDAAYDLTVFATLRESGTGKFLGHSKLKMQVDEERPGLRTDLQPGASAWTIAIFQRRSDGVAKFARYGEEQEAIQIEPGEYECELKISWAQDAIALRRTCIVGADITRSLWRTQAKR